jgi:hypothetical protein
VHPPARPRLVWEVVIGITTSRDSSKPPLDGGPDSVLGGPFFPSVGQQAAAPYPLGQRDGWLAMRDGAVPGVRAPGAGVESPYLQDT